MTYLQPHVPTDGILDTIAGAWLGGSESTCEKARDKATAELDARIERMIRSWQPESYYKVSDMTSLRDQTLNLLVTASKAIDKALEGTLTYKTTLRMAQGRLFDKMSAGLTYTNAIHTANRGGFRVVESPGFKRWVIDSMNAASVALGHVAYMNCIKPGLLSMLEVAFAVADRIVAFVAGMTRFAIAAGEAVLEIPDTAARLMKYGSYAGLAILAYYALRPKKRQNPARRRR